MFKNRTTARFCPHFLKNLKNKNKFFFKLKFRRRKHGLQTIWQSILIAHLNNLKITTNRKSISIYSSYIGNVKADFRKENIHSITRDSRLCYRNGRWYLMVPYYKTFGEKKHKDELRIAGNDPGGRTMNTLYSNNKVVTFQ